jgi:hypothetical protein
MPVGHYTIHASSLWWVRIPACFLATPPVQLLIDTKKFERKRKEKTKINRGQFVEELGAGQSSSSSMAAGK